MPLLDSSPKPSRAQRKANAALAMPRSLLNLNLRKWGRGLDLIWKQPNPADVLAALGTAGVELFQRSDQLRAFLESVKPGCTNIPQAARIKPTVRNADGTVTLAPATASEPQAEK